MLIPYNPRYASWLYYAVKYNLDYITRAARGSVIRFITKGNLEIVAPENLDDCPIIGTLSEINRNIGQRKKENMVLTTLRDTLLPKLMNGEIDLDGI